MNKRERDFDKDATSWDEHPSRVKMAEQVAGAITQQVALRPDMDYSATLVSPKSKN